MATSTKTKIAAARSATNRPARQVKPAPQIVAVVAPAVTKPAKPTKLAILIDLLHRPNGASLAEMMAATGWQAHSVRGVMAGALRHRGLAIDSVKINDIRRYRITAGETA